MRLVQNFKATIRDSANISTFIFTIYGRASYVSLIWMLNNEDNNKNECIF